MRGVMAMNMEAMNVLDKDALPKTDISAIADNLMNNVNNISNTTGGINTTNTNINNNNNNVDNCFTTVNQGLINNNQNSNNPLLNQTGKGVNIKVGVNEDNNLMATVIPANQSFQPNTLTFKNNSNNNNINNNTILNNTNPINKDSYWSQAPSVPVTHPKKYYKNR